MITEDEIKDALLRSGYLLENRISNWFDEKNYFVEPNYSFYDLITQKSREIDLFVEAPEMFTDFDRQLKCKTNFIIETINNDRPILFFINRKTIDLDNVFSQLNYYSNFPNTESDYFFSVDYKQLHHFNIILSTQYCSFVQKKKSKNGENEWMAYHPDDLHDNFRKLLYASKAALKNWQQIYYYWHQLIRFQPLLILKDNLFEAEINGTEVNLITKKHISFLFNYTSNENQLSIIIDVITEEYLKEYLEIILKEDEIIYRDMKIAYDRKITL